MIPFPPQLPTDAYGLLATLVTVLGSVLVSKAKKSGSDKQVTADNTEKQIQTATDYLLEQMAEGFAKRDARISKLEEHVEQLERKYGASLQYARALRLIDPQRASQVTIPAMIKDDL